MGEPPRRIPPMSLFRDTLFDAGLASDPKSDCPASTCYKDSGQVRVRSYTRWSMGWIRRSDPAGNARYQPRFSEGNSPR